MARFLNAREHPFTLFSESIHCLAASAAASRKTISSDTRLFLSNFGTQPVYAHSTLPSLGGWPLCMAAPWNAPAVIIAAARPPPRTQ